VGWVGFLWLVSRLWNECRCLWGHWRWSHAVKSVVGACIVGAAAKEVVGASWSSWIFILELCVEVNESNFHLHDGDGCKQKESDESKFESPFQKISSV
jgi:hypothetical protein